MFRPHLLKVLFICLLISPALLTPLTPKNDLSHHKDKNILKSLSKMKPTTFLYNCIFHDCVIDKDPSPPAPTKEKISLHIIPHSHTDAGWIETIDWYYNNKVKHIFSTIVSELDADHEMTFVWADTNFLHQWFEQQKESVQKKFQKIVKRGQIEFVGGGWVQNDESLSDVKSIINQMNLGLQYLDERFGAKPTVGWQIDPFGYNHYMPAVFEELGYEYLVLNRIGDTRKEEFKQDQSMDFWLNSAQLGEEKSEILTHILPRHYEPKDYDWLINRIPEEDAEEEVIEEFVKWFYEEYLKEQVQGFPTEEHMMLMGQDFGFSRNKYELTKIKNMMSFLNDYSPDVLNLTIDAKFSLPSTYFSAIESSKSLKSKNLDFLNYDERLVYLHPDSDSDDFDYWVGYYSTRPHLKKMINQIFNQFRSMETLVTYLKHKGKFEKKLREKFLEAEIDIGYLLHHDAITGTSRQATINDYYKKIRNAGKIIEEIMNEANQILLGEKIENRRGNQTFYYFNQASYKREQVITIPNNYENVRVYDTEKSKYLQCETFKQSKSSSSYPLYCLIEIEGLTLKNLKIEVLSKPDSRNQVKVLRRKELKPAKDLLYQTEKYNLILNEDFLVEYIQSNSTGSMMNVNQEFNVYNSSKSGIYIFKPTDDKYALTYTNLTADEYSGDLVTVISCSKYTTFTQKITLFHKGDTKIAPLIETRPYFEEFQEIGFTMNVSQFAPTKEFYNHDSNEFIKREFEEISYIEDTGRNIYPSVHGYAIKDRSQVLGIVNNYPTGCGYIKNNKEEVQCFLARNTQLDDDKGLPDVMVDHQPTTFSYFLVFNEVEAFRKDFMILSDYFNLPVTSRYFDEDKMISEGEREVVVVKVETVYEYLSSWYEWAWSETEEVKEVDTKVEKEKNNEKSVNEPGEIILPDVSDHKKGSFTLLKEENLPREVEVLDLFESHKGDLFIRVRNRAEPEFLGENLKVSDNKINLESTFIFNLEGDHKYTLNGLRKNKKTPKSEGNIIQKTLKLLDSGIHSIKDSVFQHECEKTGKAKLKPREIATFKIKK